MTPVITRLQETLFEQAFVFEDANPFAFSERIKELGPDFYQKIVSSHSMLNIEYGLLGQQIRDHLLSEQEEDTEKLIRRLISAIFLAELLEHTCQYYLIVPRDVRRMQAQQKIYRDILAALKISLPPQTDIHAAKRSFTQEVREGTMDANLYRLLFIRGKRALDLLATMDSSADWYRHVIGNLDKYTDGFVAHLGWFFYLPRLLVNLFLFFKHILPGFWMEQQEKDLGWSVRVQGQLQRRWFELGNDAAWVTVGFVNCFLLTGALAPIGTYFAIAFFGYDVLMAATRAYIELKRVYDLRSQYQAMLARAQNEKEALEIKEHLQSIDRQIEFRILRFGSHIMTTSGIFLSMCCAAPPLFAINPIIPLIGAFCLVLICLINFALVSILNHCEPKSIIEVPEGGVSQLGFFAKRRATSLPEPVPEESEKNLPEDNHCFACC